MENGRVVVVGAGIAGLAAALRLHRDGRDVLVVERAPGRRSSGYMVNLAGIGYDAAEALGLGPALAERDLGAFTSILVKADGRKKFTVPAAVAQAAVGPRMLTVFRGDLESVLYEQVRDTVEIRFGTTVTGITQDEHQVRVSLSDGTTESADLLVGADGLHSRVRELVFGTDFEVDLGHVVGAFPLAEVPVDVPPGAGTTFIGPGRTAAVLNLGPDRSSAFFTYRAEDSEAELALGPAAALSRAFGDLGGGVPGALRQLDENAYFDSVCQVVMDQWHRGRVVLLGDSAWCVTLFAGYGAALALAGADRLGSTLDEHAEVPAALAAWEAGLRAEVTKRQALARKGISQFVPSGKAEIWGRDLMMRAIRLPGVSTLIRRSIERANR
ncbi:FAD-dependent oxidoreductase [Amycolatopsis sp. 195334CR]|uniref:FAD-dependent oxidoreductase n=1 Tax=Amycolatopsis sp. 195334CR TaxID=2814588 RepID=UPI0027DB3AA0|nr:FAD-dependent oxidoreductase [Amycolatopsis sp. 195334CR]